jgi:hypothetical protein
LGILEKSPRLNARGFSKVKLQAPDTNDHHWHIFDTLRVGPLPAAGQAKP